MLNMLRRLDKIRFRGHKRDDFLDLAESPNASDTECGDEVPLKIPRTSPRDSEELRDPVSTPCGPPLPGLGPGSRGVGRGAVLHPQMAEPSMELAGLSCLPRLPLCAGLAPLRTSRAAARPPNQGLGSFAQTAGLSSCGISFLTHFLGG